MTRAQLKDLNFLGWLAWAAIFTIAVYQSERNPKPVDFVYLYSVGHILNDYGPDRLYDSNLQQETFQHVWPLKKDEGIYGPSPYPPMVAMALRPFALLPFRTAYHLWMFLSTALYVTGLLLLVKRYFKGDALRQSVLCCLGVIYWPLIVRTLLNGQLSSIGFLAIACALCLEDEDRPYLSGAALAVCSYKPTLLFLILPMLVITRRKKSLIGFAAAAASILAATTLIEGPGIWPAYLRMSAQFAAQRAFIISDYVDLMALSTSISRALWVSRTVIALGCIAGAFLVRIWILSVQYPTRIPSTLVWGTTLTWTLILNVYVPAYDTILVITSIILTGSALKRFSPRSFIAIVLGILISSYVTGVVADKTGIQILSISLIALGVLQMRLCFREVNSRAETELMSNQLSGHRRETPALANATDAIISV